MGRTAILAPELTDRMLADFLDLESSMVVTLHIQSIDQSAAIKNIKRKITDLDRMKIEEQKKAVRAGYDMDIIPSDLATFGSEAKTLLEDLQSRNERMFLVTMLVMNHAGTRQKLENNIFQAAGVAQKYNCALRRLDYQQEQGLMSSLPLGLNQIAIQRGLTTSSTAIFVPFTTQELFMNGEALYYGLNALSNNLIMADRKKLKTPNGLILGTPGSGKSFSAKQEITNAFLITQDDIAIIDPEQEYSPLVQRLGGQVIDISPASDQYINPMDLNLNYSEDDNPLTLKSDFILSLMELIVGGKAGLEPVEKTVVDRCVHMVYRDYLQDPKPEKMPVLGDLYALLREQPEKESELENAKEEADRPFPKEEELREKTARLNQLNRELSRPDKKEGEQEQDGEESPDLEDAGEPAPVVPMPSAAAGYKPSIRQALRNYEPPAPVQSGMEHTPRKEAVL